jgi:tetratricopeptide (TPR) repeat protein
MKLTLFLTLLFLTTFAVCQQRKPSEWQILLDAKKVQQAEKLCTSWSKSPQIEKQVEAQKCLANVALCKGSTISLMGNDLGGGSLGSGYTPEAVNDALKHLNEGIRLNPQDLSIHQGRLYVLETAGRFDEMAKALDESISLYKGDNSLPDWLAYTAELADMGQARAGLKLSEVIDKHYPNSHDVVGNIGAFHNMLNEPEKALPYLRRAVELAPDDPVDVWNLGWTYDHLGKPDEADKWLSKSISLDPIGKGTPGRNCLYAEFVENKLKDKERACKLEIESCEKERQVACASKP